MARRVLVDALAVGLIIVCSVNQAWAEPPASEEVVKAISFLKNLDYANVKEENQESVSQQIDQAWDTISGAGKAGLDLLKQEVKKVIAAKEKKDFFKLNSSRLIWFMGNLDEAAVIAEIWNNTTLKAQYSYVFYTAFAAARTQDPKALPILCACLKDKEGSIFVAKHAMPIEWPLTHEFLWGAYGPDGLPALVNILKESKDAVALESAMRLLSKAYYADALPHLRKLAAGSNADVKRAAIESLGVFGHPKDFDLITTVLRSKDPKDLFSAAFALYEFEDQRAIPGLTKLLETVDNDKVIGEALSALGHLLAPESVDAIKKFSDSPKGQQAKAGEYFSSLMETMKVTAEEYAAADLPKKKEWCKSLADSVETKFRMKDDDQTLSHDDLVAATAEWIKNNRITGGTYQWVEGRHVLNAASPADISLLLKAKASLYLRLSDECLYETRELDSIIRRLGRSVYRSVPGLTDKAAEKVPEKKGK